MGRPATIDYEKLQFNLLKQQNKSIVYCNICKITLKNTALERLKVHRKRCKIPDGFLNYSEAESLGNSNTNNINTSNLQIVDLDDCTITADLSIDIDSTNLICDPDPSVAVLSARSSSTVSNVSAAPSSSTNTLNLNSTSNIKPKKGNISNYVDTISSKQKEEMDMIVAKFFYGCNISFNIIESPHFLNMIKKLKPSYSKLVPSRKVLSNRLLEINYDSCLEEISATLSENSVILIDGWKNSVSNTKTVVSIIHNSNGPKAFLDAWDLTTECETGDKLTDIVRESIDLAKKNYNTNVYAVISDNASNMKKMGKNLGHVLWHSTCNSHIANLLAKDVNDAKLTENVNSVLKEFKQSDMEKTVLMKGGNRIKMACDTRWCSYRDSYENLLKNLKFFKQIAADQIPKKVKTNISKLIFDEDFIESVQNSKEMFDPICNLINTFQREKTTLAEAAFMWLSFNVQERFRDKLQIFFEKRKEMALNKYALVAYYVHPYYDNDLLSDSQMDKVNQFLLKNLKGPGIEDWLIYKNKSGIFRTLYSKEIRNPQVFWSTAAISHKNLSNLALKLLNLPASTAQIERIFSNWSQIHCPIRNRLTFNRSKKLIHIYYSLNNKEVLTPFDDSDDNEDLR